MLRRSIIVGLFAACAVVAVAQSVDGSRTAPLVRSPDALPAIQTPVVVADSSSCASACQAKHDQCRVSTKGGPDCDAERQRCLQACLTRKTK